MTKIAGSPAYLQQIARRPSPGLPFLQPAHVPVRRWKMAPTLGTVGESTLTADRSAAVVPAAPSPLDRPSVEPYTAHHASAVVTESGDPVPSLEATAQYKAERQPTLPMEKAPEVEVILHAPTPSATRTSSKHAQRQPAFPTGKAPEVEAVFEAPSFSTAQTSSKHAQRQLSLSMGKASEEEAVLGANSPHVARTPRKHTPGVPAAISTEIAHGKDATSLPRNQKSSPEIQPAPVRSRGSTGNIASQPGQLSFAVHNSLQEPGSNVPRGVSGRRGLSIHPSTKDDALLEVQGVPMANDLVSVTPRDHSAPPKAFIAGANTLDALAPGPIPGRSAQITLVPKTSERQAGSSSQKTKPEAQQQTSIHIGTIEVQIVPPQTPPLPLSTPRPTQARQPSTSALSRELTSFIGLRQG